MKRTIESLRDILRGDVYVYLKDQETCRKFYEDAEAEGFRFGDILPTESPLDDVIAVHKDKTLGHAGFAGHMKFHHPEASSGEFHRIDYTKYAAGSEDFYYREERHRKKRIEE